MSNLTTPEIEIDKIDVEEGLNARTHMDPGELDRLAGSVGSDGIVQPIILRPKEGGRFAVVGGHRRFEAAKLAGLQKVPFTLSKGNAHLGSLIENIHQERLDPVDAGRGLLAVKGELNLTTNKKLAERVNKDVEWVSERLRVLHLPEGVQRYIAAGDVPLEAERVLRDIAKVSPGVAECICKVAKRDKIKGRAFLLHFNDLFQATGKATFRDKPTMLSISGFAVSEAVADLKKRKELAERINALNEHYKPADPAVRLGEAEVDAARAAGCLVEHRYERGGMVSTTAFIVDREFGADLLERIVERDEKEATKHAEEEAAWQERQAGMNGDGSPDALKEARKAEREKKAKKAKSARAFNGDLGVNILRGRTAARRKQHSLARAKAVAMILIDDNPDLAGRGLRLVLPELQDIEVKTLKSGDKRTKVHYAEGDQCKEELLRRALAARTSDQVLEVLGEALVAGLVADEYELPQTRRIHWSTFVGKEVKKLLASDIKSLRPKRTARKEAN